MAFGDRAEAGRILADRLSEYLDLSDCLVLGLPRGGIPVAFEVAKRAHAPLDVFAVRKLGVPGHEELAMGAIATGGIKVINRRVVESLDVPDEVIAAVAAKERAELERQERLYRGARPAPPVDGRAAILVDDGLATGATMRAAVRALRQHDPRHILAAVPVGAFSTCNDLRKEADAVVCAITPEAFSAVGLWYEDFSPVTDDDVRGLLHEAESWEHHAVGRR
jgi:putative phosphoribosyl transferase